MGCESRHLFRKLLFWGWSLIQTTPNVLLMVASQQKMAEGVRKRLPLTIYYYVRDLVPMFYLKLYMWACPLNGQIDSGINRCVGMLANPD